MEGGWFVSRTVTFLESVAFLRKKPAIASYVGSGEVVGEGKGGRRGERVIKSMARTFLLFVCEVPVGDEDNESIPTPVPAHNLPGDLQLPAIYGILTARQTFPLFLETFRGNV